MARLAQNRPGGDYDEPGRLLARPRTGIDVAAPLGMHKLGIGDEYDGLLYVPSGYRPGKPAPLLVMLHGAGSSGAFGIRPVIDFADEAGTILVAPDARDRTWDIIHGAFGPDVEFIDRALADVFGRYAIDPTHLGACGFSDGASYALSIGLTNGDLFTHVAAFSPGFMAPENQRGRPAIFISHGTQDPVLPIDVCSRRIVPQLRRAGYDVTYKEFRGGHTVPANIARAALSWFAGSSAGQKGAVA